MQDQILEGAINEAGETAHHLTPQDVELNNGIGVVGDLVWIPKGSPTFANKVDDGKILDVSPDEPVLTESKEEVKSDEPIKTNEERAKDQFERLVSFSEKMIAILVETDCNLEEAEILPEFIGNFLKNLKNSRSENQAKINLLEKDLYAEKVADLFNKQDSSDTIQ